MIQAHRDHSRGTLYMLLVIAIWGAFLPVGKSALQAVDPYWLTAATSGKSRCSAASVSVASASACSRASS
jgi:hypothetical protein